MKLLKTKYYYLFAFVILIGAYCSGLLSDVIDVDAAQYAANSMEMVQSGSYVEVMERGKDYLDKPPFLFWVNSLSYQLFGFTNFAYKLPTLIFSFFSLLFTYKLGALLYDRKTGQGASIILATSLGFFWLNNDVKADGILMSTVIFSIYQLVQFVKTNQIKQLIFGSIGMAIGMMTKGPMAMIFPLAVIGFHLVLKGTFVKKMKVTWLLIFPVVGLLLLPMTIGLYEQFDLHPEKIVNGHTGVSGLRFFFWEQSFGRITGENAWKNNTSFLYLFHSLLMLIFPYSILVIVAYYRKIKQVIRKDYDGEYYTIGSLVILVALSLSSYKIPHYVMVIFPLVALVVASEFSHFLALERPKWIKTHSQVMGGLVLLVSLISLYLFDFQWIVLFVAVCLATIFLLLMRDKKYLQALVVSGILLGFVFNVHVLPSMQQYFVGRRMAALIVQKGIKDAPIYLFNRDSRALEFYLQKRLTPLSWEALIEKNKHGEPAWYFMSLDGKEALQNAGLKMEDEISLMQYDFNRINWKFLNPKTRKASLSPRFLIKFKME